MKQGNSIKLRDWEMTDLSAYKFWYTGKQKWMEYDAPYYKKPTVKALDQKIFELENRIKTNNWETPRNRLVIADKVDNKFLGSVSWYWQSEETNWKSIGITICDEKYWGKGIGYDALSVWIDYLFETCKDIVRLDLRTWSGNIGMINLSKKLGFREEARFRDARIANGKFYDSVAMGILRNEWKKSGF